VSKRSSISYSNSLGEKGPVYKGKKVAHLRVLIQIIERATIIKVKSVIWVLNFSAERLESVLAEAAQSG